MKITDAELRKIVRGAIMAESPTMVNTGMSASGRGAMPDLPKKDRDTMVKEIEPQLNAAIESGKTQGIPQGWIDNHDSKLASIHDADPKFSLRRPERNGGPTDEELMALSKALNPSMFTKFKRMIGMKEGYNSMSPAGKSLANSIKRKFVKLYPDAKVGIDGRDGWITVNGEKAVNMSQASGGPMTDEEMIEKMHAVYAGKQVDADVPTSSSRMNTFREGKMRITKRQLLQIIREEKAKNTEKYNDAPELKGDQDKLPDGLQKAIIDKEKEEKNESHHESYLRGKLRKIVRENCGGPHPEDLKNPSAHDQMELAPAPDLGVAVDQPDAGKPCPIKTAAKMKDAGASEADLMDFVNTLIDEFKSGASTVPDQPEEDGPVGDLLDILGL